MPGSTARVARYVPPTLIAMFRSQTAAFDRGARRRGRLRDGATEPASPAGHDRDLSVELRHDATLTELTREAVGEAIDLLLAVERPERDADRLGHVRLVQVLHDDPLLLPHPRHEILGVARRHDHDDARRRVRVRPEGERELGEPREEPLAQRADTLRDAPTERAMHRERLAQPDEGGGVDGARLEARR